MIRTEAEAIKKIKDCEIHNFSLKASIHEQHVVHVTFYRVHWYSFILNKRIANVKGILKNEAPICIYWNCDITRKKENQPM